MYIGELAALGTAILWSLVSIVFTEASKLIGSMRLNINRLLFASFFLFIIILVAGVPLTMQPMQFALLVGSGVVGLIFGDGFLFRSFRHIGPRKSMLVMSLSPGVTTLLGTFVLGEEITLLVALGISITLLGIFIVVLDKKETPSQEYKTDRMGYFYAFLGAVGQSGGLVLAKIAFQMGYVPEFTAAFTRILSSGVLLLGIVIAMGNYKDPVAIYVRHPKALWLTILGSIIGPVLGITLSLVAINNTLNIGIAATLMSTMPILMLPIVVIVYKEKLSLNAVFGAIVAVVGIVFLFIK